MLYIMLFILWLILVGEVTDFSIITGIIFMFVSVYITNLFYPEKTRGLVKISIMTIGSIIDMYKTTFQFIPLIFKKHYSGLTRFNSKNMTEIEKVAVSNCITLTPKTLFIDEDIEEDSLIIHIVAKSLEEAHSSKDVWEGELF